MLKKLFLVIFMIFSVSNLSFAQEASDEDDDSFDPFADYSEFIEASTEESDLNFFKFGRMLSAGVWGGYRAFTGNKGKNMADSNYFGLFFTYYFSLQFAAQVSYTTGDHSMRLTDASGGNVTNANVKIDMISFHGKYFLNTQHLTKNIAQFNPYIIGGFSQVQRTTRNSATPNFSGRDGAAGIDIGVGVEYLFNNKKAFAGLQLMYSLVNLPGDGQRFQIGPAGNIDSSRNNSGDYIQLMVSAGLNF